MMSASVAPTLTATAWPKSSDQRALGFASTRIGARVPTAFAHLQHATQMSDSLLLGSGPYQFFARSYVGKMC
jgi:hypothetical protein